MKLLKTLAISSLLVFTTSALADKNKYSEYEDEYKNGKKEKYEKEYKYEKKEKYEKYDDYEKKYKKEKDHKEKKYKELPKGLEKKMQRDEVLDKEDLKDVREIRHHERYPDVQGTKLYEIQDKIIRVTNATREILEVLK